MLAAFPAPVPEIPVTDLDAASSYYRDRMGFALDWGGGAAGLAGISRGNCRFFLASTQFRQQHGNVGPVLTWLNLDSNEDVDELHRAWRASGARLTSVPESKPWGLHEFTATDLDGNLFRVFHDFGTAGRNAGQ